MRLVGGFLTAVSKVEDIYKSTVTGRGSSSSIKDRKQFPAKIFNEILTSCREHCQDYISKLGKKEKDS